MSQLPRAVKVFLSYAHEDKALWEALRKHLIILERLGVVETWHDGQIGAGDEFAKSIFAHLNAADIILLLISSNFIASDYCYQQEMQRAMKRHEDGDARVIPIILSPVAWTAAPFGKLQALPREGKPVTIWDNRDQAYEDIVTGIQAEIKRLGVIEPKIDDVEENVDPLIPYLCDRSPQEGQLSSKLESHQSAKPQRPFVCFIHGDELECHTDFVERLQRISLPQMLKLDQKQLSVTDYPLEWPSNAQPDDQERLFLGYLGAKLIKNSAASAEDINAIIARHEQPLMVSSSFLTEDFGVHGTDILSAFMKFWNEWPDLPNERTLINVVCIKHQRPENTHYIASEKLKEIDDRLRAYLTSLDWSLYPGVSGVLLQELEAISRGDVDNWSRIPPVRKVRRIQDQEIRSLFSRTDMVNSDGRIPMETLAPQLTALLSNKQRNRREPS